MSTVNTDLIITLKTSIENLNKFHQIEILKIFNKENSNMINENNNGVFINLVDLSESLYNKLNEYIIYVNVQQEELTSIEEEKINIENEFFKEKNKLYKENKEKSTNVSINATN
jgi:hypothetical protein